MKRTCRWKLF